MKKKPSEDLKTLREKILHSSTSWRERCPLKITTLAKYIKEAFGDSVIVELQDWSAIRGRQMSSGVYYTQNTYYGKRLRVSIIDKKYLATNPDRYRYSLNANGKYYETIIDHNTAEGYRRNQEICEKIMEIEKILKSRK